MPQCVTGRFVAPAREVLRDWGLESAQELELESARVSAPAPVSAEPESGPVRLSPLAELKQSAAYLLSPAPSAHRSVWRLDKHPLCPPSVRPDGLSQDS